MTPEPTMAKARAKAKATAKTTSKAAAKKASPAAKKASPAAQKTSPPAKKTKPAADAASERRGEGRTRSHLQAGDRAPAFALQGDDGQRYSLASMKGKRFVLYFYPKDNTPGCTRSEERRVGKECRAR